MGYKCFVPGCKTGYDSDTKQRKKEGKNKLSLFRAPQDENRLQRWIKAIPRSDREIGRSDRVCELHFLPEEISRQFVHKIAGKEVFIEKEVPSLMHDAVPTIFPNLPPYLSKNKRKRKSPVKRSPLPKRVKRESTENKENEQIAVDEILHQFTFDNLLTNLSQVCKPHKLWAVSSHEDFIVCVKWNLNFTPEFACHPERQIFIDSNLDVKEIRDFISYLDEWKNLAAAHGSFFLPASTYHGLKVTLSATLELLLFLTTDQHYEFLMTARLNQDSLEKFFGILRSAGGANDHPDPTVFLQLFRLIGVYSLIKPPKGSNIEGSEMFKTLIQNNEGSGENTRRQEVAEFIDGILNRGGDPEEVLKNEDHCYSFIRSSDWVVAYVTGFVARKLQTTKCPSCSSSLIKNKVDAPDDREKLISIKSKGYLIRPSDSLFNLIKMIEECVLDTLATQPLSINILNKILMQLEDKRIPRVGCTEHSLSFTNTAMQYYLVMRLCFICKRENQIDLGKKKKRQEHKKLSKI